MKMTAELYTARMDLLVTLADTIAALPLAEMREIVERADSVGPFLDPTAWRKGSHNLEDQRELLEAASQVQRAIAAIRERAVERMARSAR